MRGTWKIAAIAMLLIAPAAFGAAAVRFTPNNTDVQMSSVPTTATFEVWLDLDGGTKVGSLDPFIIQTAGPYGALTVTAVESNTDSVLTGASKGGNGNWTVPMPFVDGNSFVDLGGFNLNAEAAASEKLCTVTVEIAGGLPEGTVLTLDARGIVSGSGSTLGSNPIGDAAAYASFTIVPEPVSMLLVAVGAAFFARRRRA